MPGLEELKPVPGRNGLREKSKLRKERKPYDKSKTFRGRSPKRSAKDVKARNLMAEFVKEREEETSTLFDEYDSCLLYTSPSPRDATLSRMPSSA